MGSTCACPPPAAPPFIPNTGPIEGSRKTTVHCLPNACRPRAILTVVTVLPLPVLVGDIEVTNINLPFRSGDAVLDFTFAI